MNVASATTTTENNAGALDVVARLSDYWLLAKPRIAVMAMFTVAIGYALGFQQTTGGAFQSAALANACFGIFCVAVSCSFLNQWLEQDVDRRMNRTCERPLAARRVSSGEVLAIGVAAAVLGIAWLVTQVNLLTGLVSITALLSYVALYTPLKRVSFLCTQIGALAGALPPVLGWCAAGGQLDSGAWALFLLLFCWQFPHFLAIATIYRADYEHAGLKMLPVMPGGISCAGLVSVAYAAALLPVSFLAYGCGVGGYVYLSLVLLGGLAYLAASVRFWLCDSVVRARQLVLCSLIYLPVVLVGMVVDQFCIIR